MATTNDDYLLFDTQSPLMHGVNPQTGNFHTYIPIASLVGNNGLGPTLDINLFYSPDMRDFIFKNWALRFSHYFELPYDTPLPDSAFSLYSSTGEAWSFLKGSLDSPNITFTPPTPGDETAKITRKDGTIELLERHLATLFSHNPGEDIDATYYILKQVISPSGHSLTLNWKNYRQDHTIFPQLISINDETRTLLKIDYSPSLITFNTYPDSLESSSYEFDISENGISKSSRNNTLDVKNYRHYEWDAQTYNENLDFKLTSITHASGLTETLTYDNSSGKITNHRKALGSTILSDIDYTYTATRDITTAKDKIQNTETRSYFDSNKQQTKQIIKSGESTKTVETNNEFNKDKGLTITTRTTYQNKQQQTRTEEAVVTLDTLGNLIAKTENGVTTEWTYYRGMFKEEVLVKTETFSKVDGLVGGLGWIGDNLHPIGWGFQLFGKAGLTWGTREIRTVTHSRWVTNTGRSTFNLPVDIACPGDPNYFRVYVESEKVYTVRNGQRVDLQWTYYGYGDLPVKGTDAKGPAVKPTIKLTVRNPIGDANGRLSSWQNGTMTVEETRYITDVNSLHHGRIQSTSQRILDGYGNAVPDSSVNTAFDYSLANGHLTTTTTIVTGNTPALTQKETRQAINGQLLTSTDALGSTTAYQYDGLGRLTQQLDYANDGTPNATTSFSYVDSPAQGNTVTRTSPVGEQTRESFDPLGRLVKTERLHSDGWTWLTLASSNYDAQGRERSVTEYDYHPDGSVFLSRTRTLSYDDWGAVSKVEWAGGATQGFDYDPVSRQQSQWVTYGARHSASTTAVIDEPGGSRRLETLTHTNSNLTRSYTATYDASGRLVQESSSDAPTRQYMYDAFGRLIRITAAGEVTLNEYPAHTPVATASAARIESAGQSITLGTRVIDSQGRVTQSTVGGRTTSLAYSGASYWGKASDVRSNQYQQAIPITLSTTYDPNQNQATETTTGGVVRNSNNTTSTVQYTRSLRGVLLSERDAFGNSTTYDYDAQGRMTSSSSAMATVNFYYDDVGRLASEILSNTTNNRSMVTRYTYDDKDREIQRKFEAQGFKTLTVTQDYNSAYQISNMALYEDTTMLRKETFGYDNKGRLASYSCDGPRKPITPEGLVLDKQSFTYDAIGNIKQCDNTANGRVFPDTYQYDSLDPTQLVRATRWNPDNSSRTYTFTYDSLGNLSNNTGTKLQYNTLGRLATFESSKGAHSYAYNNLGMVAGCAGTNYFEQFYYQGDYQYARKGTFLINNQDYKRTCVLLNKSSACVLQQNTQNIDNGPATVSYSFEIKDIKGTVIASHNMLDGRTTFFTYTPFGYRPDDWQNTSWIGFNGQPLDRVNGCYHLGNGVRVYNPESQIFQSPDRFSPFGKGGANSRSYCHNDPINYSDPSGYAEVVHQYTVITHSPAIYDPVVQAVLFGGIGVALAPFTGGASLGWTVATTGLAIVSAGFGIASAALQKSDPKLAEAFEWTALGTGLLSAGAGTVGAKLARTGLQAGSKYAQNTVAAEYRIARNGVSRAGKSGAAGFTGEVTGFAGPEKITGSFELYVGGNDTRTLFIDAHGLARKGHTIAPLPDTEVIFRSGVGTKASDKGYSFSELINDNTPYRYVRGATDIPDYVLAEFPVDIYISDGRLGANFKADLLTTATHLKADIVRPTDFIRLSDLLNELHGQGYHYERIVGNFCRGNIPTWTPGFVKPFLRTHGLF